MIGKTLGHYRVVEKIGAGGMGEVYRANDTRLGRDVALKLLPETFASDPERLARFEREARLLASLNHPNIAAIHGLEEAAGVRFLVLELVEGLTLAERLTPPSVGLPVEEALGVSLQIAEALEAAHEKGIIHRDLKPANVKVTPQGGVKVLDFGLAKAFEADATATDLSKSPTASYGSSREGVILGTAAYMSPEQARGKPLDKRTDIWSFGCLLYELLTGRQAFSGETVSDTIATILKGEPDWSALPASLPTNIRVLLRRCLQKEPTRRLRDIGEARITIEESLIRPEVAIQAAPAPAKPTPTWQRVLPWAVAGTLAIALGVSLWLLTPARGTARQPVARFSVSLPADAPLGGFAGPFVAVSPDGTRIAYVAARAGASQLFVRAADQFEAVPLSGTEWSCCPFFSPDGQWIGFISLGQLKKVSVGGGTRQVISDAALGASGGAWGPDDTIVFTPTTGSGLSRVPAAGGAPEPLTTLDSAGGESGHLWPQFLPGGKALLFTIQSGTSFDEARIAVLPLDADPQKVEPRVVLEGGSYARYVSTGHLLYVRGNAIWAVLFDLDRLEVTGSPVRILEGIATDPVAGAGHFAFSDTGLLIYAAATPGLGESTLVWVDRQGKAEPIVETRRMFEDLALSPNGKHVATTIVGPITDIWVLEVARGTLTRLTFEQNNRDPLWTPDGKRVTYGAMREGKHGLFWKPADGSGPEERLTASDHHQWANSWSPDGKVLAFTELCPNMNGDILLLRPEEKGKPGKVEPFVASPFTEWAAVFSPDGRWLAYESNESGRFEIYVRLFPGPGGKIQISTEGGNRPMWSPNGRELFYRNGEKFIVVDVETHPTFRAGKPRLLFEGRYVLTGRNYEMNPDGQRFVAIRSAEQEAVTQLRVVLNWFEELHRRVP